jgi:hypothetical protein
LKPEESRYSLLCTTTRILTRQSVDLVRMLHHEAGHYGPRYEQVVFVLKGTNMMEPENGTLTCAPESFLRSGALLMPLQKAGR